MFKIVTFDTHGEGFGTILKDYQEAALRYLWRLGGGGASSRDVWVNVNKELVGTPRRSISRASIINFMNHMVDEGIVNFTEITGKGGHRRIYSAKYDEPGTKLYLAKMIISKLLETWPEDAKKTIESMSSSKSD